MNYAMLVIDTFQMNLVTWRQEIDFLKLVKGGLEKDINEKTRLTEKLEDECHKLRHELDIKAQENQAQQYIVVEMTQKTKQLIAENEKLKEKVMSYSVAETEEVKKVPAMSIVEQKGAESAEPLD